MKTKLIIILSLILPLLAWADTNGPDGGRLPSQGVQIAYKGADGNLHFASSDNAGNTSVVQAVGAASGASTVASTNYEASRVLKASPGTLMGFHVYNSKAVAQFIQLFNSTTVPADGAVPVMTITVPSASNYDLPLTIPGMPFSTGIVVSNSTTGNIKTVGLGDCYFTAIIR